MRAAKACGRDVRPKRALSISVRPKVREWDARPRRAAQVCNRARGHVARQGVPTNCAAEVCGQSVRPKCAAK
eukprot:5404835-Pleurochrysis_carterae.AAC.1